MNVSSMSPVKKKSYSEPYEIRLFVSFEPWFSLLTMTHFQLKYFKTYL